MSTIPPGTRLHGRFVLVERIGVGGMSQVWRATDEVLGRPVAVKMLSAELAADPALQEATWREARAAARLTHPHVTRIYDYGEAPLPGNARAPYLVMELVEGQSLAERLRSGALPWQETARLGAQVAAALAAAHQVGVVHHDVKPGNVMLTADGAKVLDFGIAALIGATDQELLAGTPSYAAPERLRKGPADPANDIYSLGVLLYECLTGEPPARLADWSAAMAAHRAGPVPAPALAGHDSPPALAELVTACLSTDPARRPEARQVAARLSAAAGVPDPTAALPSGQPTVVTPLRYAVGSAAPPAPTPRTAIDHAPTAGPRGGGRLMLAGITVGVVVLGLVIALAVVALQRPDTTAGNAPDPTGTIADPPPTTPEPEPTGQARPQPGPLDNADEIVAELERIITEAFHAGRIDEDAVDDLWEEVQEIREELAEDYPPGERLQKVREAAEELREEIDDLLGDREIPTDLADQLREVLRPLLRGDDR